MTQYGVNPQSMMVAGDEGQRVAQAVQTALTSMNEDVRRLMEGHWSGQARDQYNAAFQQCLQAAAQIPQIVNRTVGVIAHANETYANAEKVNSGIFGG